MQVFAGYAVRKEQPLVQTYLNCAKMVDGGCGVGYANVEVQVGSVDSGMENGNQGGEGKNGAGRAKFSALVVGIAGLAAMMPLL